MDTILLSKLGQIAESGRRDVGVRCLTAFINVAGKRPDAEDYGYLRY